MTLIPDPVVKARVHIPCAHANALALSSDRVFSASSAVQAGVQTALLNPPANPTPPIALANRTEFKSREKANNTYAKVAKRKPERANFFLPYLSAAKAKGIDAIVLARADAAVVTPMTSEENPISFK